MTPKRFIECLEALHWSKGRLTKILSCDEGLVEVWMLGLEEIPLELGAWLEALARAHEAIEGYKPNNLRGLKANCAKFN